MKIQFIAILLISLAASCVSNGSKGKIDSLAEEDGIVCIDIPEVLKSEKTELRLSDEVDKIDIVPLETTGQSLLSTIVDVFITDEDIFIQDFKNGVFRFSRDGTFLNKIGKHGQGPGEYLYVDQLIIDHDKVLISEVGKESSATRRIHIYDFEGQFLQTVITPKLFVGTLGTLLFFNGEKFAVDPISVYDDFRKNYWTVALLDSSFNVKQEFYNPSFIGREEDIWENRALSYGWKNFWEEDGPFISVYKNDMHVCFYQEDTIHLFDKTNKELKPKYIMNMGDKPTFEISHQFIKDPSFFKYISLYNIYDTQRYFYFVCTRGDKLYNVCYSKESGEILISEKQAVLREKALPGSPGFILRSYDFRRLTLKNDLCGGDFYVRFTPPDKYWVSVVESSKVEDLIGEIMDAKVKNEDLKKEFIKKLDMMKEEDNPILLIATLK